MSAFARRSPSSPTDRPHPVPPGPCDGPERLRWLIRRIADDDRDAFAELFDSCSDGVSRHVHRQVHDRHRVAGIVAGTFVEVWWLAGFHIDVDTDVLAWLSEIVQRRIADSGPDLQASADTVSPGPALRGARWTQIVEVELVGILGRRRLPPAGH